ncbi:MAG TPA: FecR family protein, partial [Bradyrhizobium sp.]|nr:FecR family protein [Bradyrhizobium sp.]
VITAAGDQTALIAGATLKPGDNVRTGQNGRALLMRGQETILISPNSAIGIPKARKEGLSTSIIQQSGSILLEVEKRNVKHFEVETPYLAAVVKGTQFRVTVDNSQSRVDVLRGQVEVMAFKSGQYALVKPGQAAQVAVQGSSVLSLSGTGALSPIQHATPRSSSVSPLPGAMPAPESKPVAPQARVAMAPSQPETIAAAFPAASPNNTASSGGWISGFAGTDRISGSSSGRRNQTEDIALALAFSVAVGAGVAVVVGAQRRRKSRKMMQG